MMLLPYECLTIETRLSPEEARRKLTSVVEPRSWFRSFGSGHKPYQGEVSGYEFKVTRVILYRNSFLPVIKGEIHPEGNGSAIHITMRPHILVLVFVAVWLGYAGYLFLSYLGDIILSSLQIHTAQIYPIVLLAPGALLVFGYALLMGGFKLESVKSKAFFQELFEARSTRTREAGHERRYFGMTVMQITILVILAMMSCVVLVVAGKLIFPSIVAA